jgi:hypothetical protein
MIRAGSETAAIVAQSRMDTGIRVGIAQRAVDRGETTIGVAARSKRLLCHSGRPRG